VGLDTENTPNELIQQWSPPHKKPLSSAKGKENEENVFFLARRPRKRRDSSGLCVNFNPIKPTVSYLIHLKE